MGVLNLDSAWVNDTINSLSLDQKIGQMLHPYIQAKYPVTPQLDDFGDIEPGGIFIFPGTKKEFGNLTSTVQIKCKVPTIFSSDLENGAGRMINDAVKFPDMMSVSAANDDDLAKTMGEAAAKEGREVGVHWTFGPVVDINWNPHNPITNTRSLGDDPEKILHFAKIIIKAMQENGLVATAKHFPGDGFDDRDQHLCTTINHLSKRDWLRLSGRMFKEVIDEGVWTIMTGHISLPSVNGNSKNLLDALPATLSKTLTTDLLRGELGFDGLIVTDAIGMGGFTSWGKRDELLVKTINAGSDMLLFCELKDDFAIIKRAVEDGKITEDRINESVRRILALKEKINLNNDVSLKELDNREVERFTLASKEMSKKAITLVKDDEKILPLSLDSTKKVLVYHMRGDEEYNVDELDNILSSTGVKLSRFTESTGDVWKFRELLKKENFDYIIVASVFGPTWATGRIRWADKYVRQVNDLVTGYKDRLIVVSFGSPYHLYEFPKIPLYINAYSLNEDTQKAVVNMLVGEFSASGLSPVDLDAPYRSKIS